MKRRRVPAVKYPEGFFTEPMRLHNFPPGWKPQGPPRSTEAISRGATASREKAESGDYGWREGSIPMPKTPKHMRPGWLERKE